MRFTAFGVPIAAQWVKNPTGVHENSVRSLASLSGGTRRCCDCGVAGSYRSDSNAQPGSIRMPHPWP